MIDAVFVTHRDGVFSLFYRNICLHIINTSIYRRTIHIVYIVTVWIEEESHFCGFNCIYSDCELSCIICIKV